PPDRNLVPLRSRTRFSDREGETDMKRKWWLLAAGVLFSCAHWWKHVESAPPAPGTVVVDDKTSRATGDFEIELTRARRAPRTKRVASTLLFVTLFCAGAASTAGA